MIGPEKSAFSADRRIVDISFDNSILRAAVSETPIDRQKGLSNVPLLFQDEGMIFVFNRSGTYKFWMKDMLMSIDMIWVNDKKIITHIEPSVAPETYPRNFGPDRNDSLYIIETNAGYAKKNSLEVGQTVSFEL